MNYKMVVLDLDDTLLRDDLTLSERNKKTLLKAQELGVKVVLASGRPTYAMKNLAEELGLYENESYLISYNGASITSLGDNRTIFESSLTKETAHELYDISIEHGMYIHTYVGDDIVTPVLNEYTDIEAKITGMPLRKVSNFYDTVDRNVIKVLMVQEPSRVKQVAATLGPEIALRMNMTISKPFFLEFMDRGIDKGTAVEKLIGMIGIKREEVIAIGDSYNDIGMIRYAGLGVCMANAPDDIKKEADYITDSNMEDGVAKVIEEFVLRPPKAGEYNA